MFQLKLKKTKKESHNQLDEFYRSIKLKAQSQDTHKQADFFDEKYRFKSKDNKHWVSTKILHTIDTFKEATKKIL